MTTITLCRLEDIADGGALGLPEHQHLHPSGLVAVRQGMDVWVYINRCPHFSVPLNYHPQEFCTYRGKILMCAHHSAMFRFEDGGCIDGPCKGAQLAPVSVRRVGDRVVLDI
ncbi:protein PnpX2 [Pseudomonas fluorescens]|uniref:Protein PnpX2 n=1 Tax=Pseudomonas fluorescens TaxID=294 RepID=A0A379IFX5_PSEFL|nr:Rieske 2Fe-2S domain-containing protein [Pseudomonas fluorescens]AIG01941.1 2Fe-2S ferredoxin [Pseudomonas fluorescens]SUD31740.1 protein PnpX2 [Pseudomonas fluorescens]